MWPLTRHRDRRRFFGAGFWTPSQLGSSLALWLDAEDTASIILNGSTVSQWSDKSGRANHVSNATAATQPAYLPTGWLGKPTVSFTLAAGEFLFGTALNNFAANNDYFIGAVFELFQTNNNYEMIAGWRSTANATGANGAPVLQAISTSTAAFGVHNTDVATTTVNVSVTTRLNKRIATAGRTGGTNGNGGTVTVTATGNSQPTYDTTASQTWASATVSNFQIGGRQQQGATGYGDKYISEIVCCSANLTPDDRQRVEGYLAWKWGLEADLPVGHPYKTIPPTR